MLEKLMKVSDKYETELYNNIDQIKCYLEDIDKDTLWYLVADCRAIFDVKDNSDEIFSTYDFYPLAIGDDNYNFRIYRDIFAVGQSPQRDTFIEISGQGFRIQIPLTHNHVFVKTSNNAHWDNIKLTEAYLLRKGLERFLDNFPAFISCAEELIVGKYNQELNKYTELKAREGYCEPKEAPMTEEDV